MSAANPPRRAPDLPHPSALSRRSAPRVVEPRTAMANRVNGSQAARTKALFGHADWLYRAGRFAEAAELTAQALELDPRSTEMWNARGVFLRSAGCPEEAVWCYQRCLTLAPQNAGCWSNLGNALGDLKRVESAILCHRRAIALAPREARSHENLGLALMLLSRHDEAVAAFDDALRFMPDDPQILWHQGRARLYLGDYPRGWAGYEARLRTGDLPVRRPPGKCWRGEPYRNRRLLVISEQGFGDGIWIARYLRQIKALGGELIVECRRELLPLIGGMEEVDRAVEKADPLPDADLHCYLCSIPGLYTADLAAIPPAPYLRAPGDRRKKFARVLARRAGRLRVGIVWSGSTTFKANKDRAVPLRAFLEAFALPGVQLYSLQKGPPEAELRELPAGAPIIDLGPLLQDFADTATAVAELDLIIMTDSAVAHLAGALGKPVWVLLGFMSHWLWLLERTDSPWYPSMRLFRARSWGDWSSVFDAAGSELLRLAHAEASAIRCPSGWHGGWSAAGAEMPDEVSHGTR
jgi:Flp pilus assembly protein TadD